MIWIFDSALWLAAAGQFGLLLVSSRVPHELRWRTELAALSPINRKLMWIFGGYVVFTYLAFGVLTVVLHDELLRGDRAATALAIFIGLYWLVRLALDGWMGSAHWSTGLRYRLAHVALNLLLAFLSVTYLALAAWHLGGPA
jgi:alginate O-acetyltransferase complex protein AlgI